MRNIIQRTAEIDNGKGTDRGSEMTNCNGRPKNQARMSMPTGRCDVTAIGSDRYDSRISLHCSRHEVL